VDINQHAISVSHPTWFLASHHACAIGPLPLSLQFPSMIFAAVRIKRAFDVAGQRFHNADARKHCRPAIGNEDQGFHSRLPLRCGVDLLQKPNDVVSGV
jgi:hypothetical protein